MQITLIKRAIKRITFENSAYEGDPNSEITLEAKQESRVDFDFENRKLVCSFTTQLIEDVDKPRVNLVCEMVGLFSCDDEINDDNKSELHLLSCQKLYPYLVETIASISCNSGIAPIILPPLGMSISDIKDIAK